MSLARGQDADSSEEEAEVVDSEEQNLAQPDGELPPVEHGTIRRQGHSVSEQQSDDPELHSSPAQHRSVPARERGQPSQQERKADYPPDGEGEGPHSEVERYRNEQDRDDRGGEAETGVGDCPPENEDRDGQRKRNEQPNTFQQDEQGQRGQRHRADEPDAPAHSRQASAFWLRSR